VDSRHAGRPYGRPRRVHNLLLLEGTGTNLRLTLNAPFTPAELNAIYNNSALPGTSTSDGIVGSGSSASCAAPAYACYAGALLRVWDPKSSRPIADQWNLTIQHQFWGDTHPSNWLCGAEGHSLDGAIRLRAATTASQFFLRDSAVHCLPARSLPRNPTLYSVLGHPNATPPET